MTRYEFYGNLNTYKKIQKEKDELKHYGTIGQKWGVRKWQNYDGTFNEAGKERYFGSKKAQTENGEVGSVSIAIPLAVWGGIIALELGATVGASAIKDAHVTNQIKKFEKNLATEETDPKSGFKLKNKEMSTKEDMKYVNMEHEYAGLKQKNADAKEGTSNNCSLCTTAMVLRQKGYDVRANKNIDGKSWEQQEKIYKNAKVVNGTFKDIIKELESQPEGSYGHFGVVWREAYGSAHSMFYKIENGKPVIYCTQTNKIWKTKDLNKYASPLKDKTGYMRCDNLEVNFDYVKENELVR